MSGKTGRGNPHFMDGIIQRREQLLKELRANSPTEQEKVLARFALSNGIRLEKAKEYYNLLKLAGYLEVGSDGQYLPLAQ